MRTAAILGLCVLAAIAYGIALDQVTARVCVEYFTIGHPPIFGTEDPTLLAFGWGVVATWWVGLGLGIPLAIASALGPGPRRDARSLLRPIASLMAVVYVLAALSGLAGYLLARSGSIRLVEPLASSIDPARHPRFLADLWAHLASYAVGFVGGWIVIVRVYLSRRRLGTAVGLSSPPAGAGAADRRTP